MLEVLSGIANPRRYGVRHNVYVLKSEGDMFWGR